MKNLGWRFGGETQHVLYLVARQAELSGDSVDGSPREEQANHHTPCLSRKRLDSLD